MKTSLQTRSSLKKPPVAKSKSSFISSIPSTEETSALLLPEKVEPEGVKEDTHQGKSSSNENADSTTKVLDVTTKPKSKRRKSFTSLLVTGSKVHTILLTVLFLVTSFSPFLLNLVTFLVVRRGKW